MRLFQTTTTRRSASLDGLWRFIIDKENCGIDGKWYENFPSNADKMCVPGCWNLDPKYFAYEGVAWYQTEFTAEEEIYVLEFSSVLMQATVYIDGAEMGSHYGGFTPFCITGRGKGWHQLTVRVDNTHNAVNTIPLSRVDWYHYGGIAGQVKVTSYAGAYIADRRISYELNGNQACGTVEFRIAGEYRGDAEIRMNDTLLAKVPVSDGENRVPVSFGEIVRWDTECPQLYQVRIAIEGDDVTERVGFRTVETRGTKILLNGKEIRLKAVNRHNEHPDFGFSMPFSLMKRDADIIKNLGCNMIRGSHYPNPPEFLDYLDEIGMLFWEEIPMWGYETEALTDPLTCRRGLAMHEEMVRRDYHHPSVIFWGLHNEIFTDIDAGYQVTKKFCEKVKSLDTSRLVTYASFKPEDDISLEFADVISMNVYPGWYGGHDIEKEGGEIITKIMKHLRETGNDNKPLIISEFGAGAVFGERSFYDAKWTEQYQVELLERLIPKFFAEDAVQGLIIWQYCDVRSSFELELTRPRNFNNKGLVDEYRRPKAAYYAVKKIYERF